MKFLSHDCKEEIQSVAERKNLGFSAPGGAPASQSEATAALWI